MSRALAAALLLYLPAACGGSPVLRDLHSLNQLQAAFNEDAGTARLVLLLSPT